MNVEVDVQYAAKTDGLPSAQEITSWVEAALAGRSGDAELTVRVVDEAEIAGLNRTYRGRDRPTNVLSFPYDEMPGVDIPLLGDIVVCAPVVAAEAREQGKTRTAHWAHMVVHGALHLLGYQHEEPPGAVRMEQQEKKILLGLGFEDPYEDTGDK